MPESLFSTPAEFVTTETTSSDMPADRSTVADCTFPPWLDSDLSQLDDFEPYDWKTGEIEAVSSVAYDPEQGFIILLE